MMTQTFRFPLALVMAQLALVACTKSTPQLNKQPNVELIQDMMDQPALKPQDYHPGGNNDKPGVRLPPAGTVPVGFKPYPYKGNPQAAAGVKNPLAGDLSPKILEHGRMKFDTYCAVCHGYEAKGDGPVAPKMSLKPPSLVSDKILKATDGTIYHIVSDGQGVMASYFFQLPDERDRWTIVNYVRSLQKLASGSAGAPGGAAGKKEK